PRLTLRTYKSSDHDQVDHLFYSTYFALVPEGVKSKIKSFTFWVLWFMFYSYLLSLIPVVLAGMNWPQWASTVLNIFISFAWFVVSFAGVFIYTDRFEVVDKVEKARQNDLSDPEIYYLNWTKEEVVCQDDDGDYEDNKDSSNNDRKKRVTFDKDAKPATEVVRVQKPIDQQAPSHFWVLCLDNRPCGIVGLAHYKQRVYSNSPVQPAAWKLMLAAFFERYHIPTPAFLSNIHNSMP
ncbi:hypothetical protein BDF20DRAFT_800186, partial [Mycotypha africana]|uniref:uncharacterized protein n=1 Tax=Mycotypha africana TaxID=64632 RepID=UPI002301B3F3